MPVRPETRARLLAHVGIPATVEGGAPTISNTTYGAVDSGRREAAIADFLRLLEVVNHELNGDIPSEVVAGEDDDNLPAKVAYAVAEAARMLRVAGYEDPAWRIETAWLGVLSGDIDNIVEHMEEEERMRSR